MQHQLRAHLESVVPLTDEEFTAVLPYFTSKRFKKHQFLLRERERVLEAYLVVAGLLKLVHTDAAGKSHIVSFAMED